MIALEFGQPRNEPAHRESRQRRYMKQPPGWRALPDMQTNSRHTVECRAGFGEQIRPRPCRNGITARAPEKVSAKPILEQSYLSAHGDPSHVEVFRRSGRAAQPRLSFE